MTGNCHVRCGVGENFEITSKNYLSLSPVAIIFGCLLFTLTAPLYIWSVVGM